MEVYANNFLAYLLTNKEINFKPLFSVSNFKKQATE